MENQKTINDKYILELSTVSFGGKVTAKHYLKKAFDASKQAKVDLAANNIPNMVYHTTQMIQAIEQMNILFGDARVDVEKDSR